MADTNQISAGAAKGGAGAKPGTRSAASLAMQVRTDMMRAVYGGTETMRAKGDAFLPQYDKESNKRYQARLASTFAVNKLREAVDAASAKPFKSVLGITNNTDPDLDLWIKNIDLTGNNLHLFAHTLFNDAMLVGQGHILVDHPTTANMPSLGAQLASGVRPFFKFIRDENLLAAYDEPVGGEIQTVHARIAAQRTVLASDFTEQLINQVFVLEVEPGATQGIVQLYEQAASAGGDSWDFMGETPLTIPRVPLVTLRAGEREADWVTRPVFLDLAYKQIEHWISSSDQRSILSAARFPMLAASGVELDPDDDEGFAIGPYKVLYSPDAQGRWYYVEPKGTAIESGFRDLEVLEMQMNIMALNPTTATTNQYVAKDERDVQETRAHSVVHDLAISARETLQRGIQFMGLWTGKDFSKVGIEMNTDFTNTADKAALVATLINAWDKRAISRETFLLEARRLDFLSDDFDITAELARLALLDAAGAGVTATGTGATNAAQKDPVQTPQPPADFEAGRTRPTRQI
jgi:hypothetical protein